MIFGIVGLGLIGGSLARSIKFHSSHTVYGLDKKETALLQARMVGAIDGELTEENIGDCDMVLVALYPEDAVNWVLAHLNSFKPGSLVVDCCGVKRFVCDRLYPAFEGSRAAFMGGHPMAGRERSGFTYAQDDLFENASMILAPAPGTEIETIRRAKEIFLSIGFAKVRFTTPREHDEMIAFTSQLAHVVSSAYVKTPLAPKHKGFSAGSFRDMTRVARLNEDMWTELFLENDDLLLTQIEALITNLQEYYDAMKNRDEERLRFLLREGREIKEGLEEGN
ncbi:MAG: prephenate dehydrogenase [Clostridia bacterium]|nr:prephenate dehydrogenase [Clostridia bacterium]